MKTYTAYSAKQRLGELIDHAQESPVTITKYGYPVTLVTSQSEYKDFLKIKKTKELLAAKGVDFQTALLSQRAMKIQQGKEKKGRNI